MTIAIPRRALLHAAAALPIATSAEAALPGSGAQLRTIPTTLYRSTFNERETLDGWVFFLMLETRVEGAVSLVSLRLIYRAGDVVTREEMVGGGALDAIARQDISPARLTGEAPVPAVYWPQAVRVHCYVPQNPKVTELQVELKYRRGDRSESVEAKFPIVDFEQRTALRFPFSGPATIAQGGVLSGGHRNRSGGFALDALALDANYAPVLRPGSDRPEDYAGWGRTIVSPADGLVVEAVGDRPDQPKDGVSDPAFYAPQYPHGGDVGNHVVIDHGHGEYSLIAHMRSGSVRVKPGERVTRGQPVGELGNSGDTSGPHMHYQLQDGPQWEYADGLPMRFENLPILLRGAYFEAP